MSALVLAACGASGGGASARPTRPSLRLAAAVASAPTVEARTARVSMSVTVDDPAAGTHVPAGELNLAGTGVVDLQAHRSALSVSVPLLDRIGGGGHLLDERVTDGTAFLRLPGSSRWLSVGGTGSDRSTVAIMHSDPVAALARLDAAGDPTTLRFLGADAVRGVTTRHYRSLAQHLDVWLDADRRARRVVVTAADGPVPVTVQEDLYDFGVTIPAIAPPGAMVTPFSSLGLGRLVG